MNIVILVGGVNSYKFIDEDYSLPKPLIHVKGKHMIFYLLDSLIKNLYKNDQIFITYSNLLKEFAFEAIIRKEYPTIDFVFTTLAKETKGASETLFYTCTHSIPETRRNNKTVSFDCDGYYTTEENILQKVRKADNGLIYFDIPSNDAREQQQPYSYIQIDDDKVTNIQEKKKFVTSTIHHANTGCYFFRNVNIIESTYNDKCQYITDLIRILISKNVKIVPIQTVNYVCLGTPLQVKIFSSKETIPLRFCFDLDGTLVTFPTIPDDYNSVLPIQKNIDFLKSLKKLNHTIIIHTARKMKSSNGNLGKVLKDVGKITFETLEKFGIEYDEIYFGKPSASFYIDDKAVNAYADLHKETGFYFTTTKERKHNNLILTENNTYIKSSSKSDIEGQIYYYNNIPESLKHFFPKLIKYTPKLTVNDTTTSYEMERINGVTLSYLYINTDFGEDILKMLILAVQKLHIPAYKLDERKIDYYANYSDKLKERYDVKIYDQFEKSKELYTKLIGLLDEYKSKNFLEKRIIHGDLVFTNILLDEEGLFKLIDMRGKVGNELTIFGDTMYDWAKIYQSLLGYDFILNDKEIDHKYIKKYSELFFELLEKHCGSYINVYFKYIKIITASLFFSLIPLHISEGIEKCNKYYKIAYDLIYNS